MLIAIIIVILAIGAGVVSAYQYLDGVKKDKENAALNSEIKAAQSESLELSKKLSEAQNKTILKADQLIKAQNEIIDLQKRLSLYTIGDGKIPLLTVSGGDLYRTETTSDYSLDFVIHNNSDYPLRNISLKFSDNLSMMNKIRREYGPYIPSIESVVKLKNDLYVKKDISSLSPNASLIIYTGYIPTEFFDKADSVSPFYLINILWDNGSYELTFSLKKIKERLVMTDIKIWDNYERQNLNIKELYKNIKYKNVPLDKSVYDLNH